MARRDLNKSRNFVGISFWKLPQSGGMCRAGAPFLYEPDRSMPCRWSGDASGHRRRDSGKRTTLLQIWRREIACVRGFCRERVCLSRCAISCALFCGCRVVCPSRYFYAQRTPAVNCVWRPENQHVPHRVLAPRLPDVRASNAFNSGAQGRTLSSFGTSPTMRQSRFCGSR